MFVLTRISDVIPVAPSLFDTEYTRVLTEQIERKYANKVLADVGLCLTVYDFVSIGDALIHPSDGTAHTQVEFRMVVFRPFVGEVLKGKIVSCDEDNVRVSMGFMEDILIPSFALQSPSHFNTSERLWVWKYPDSDDSFFMDLDEEIRFRVTSVKFTPVNKTAKGMQAKNTEASQQSSKVLAGGTTDERRRRQSSVDLLEKDSTPSAIQVMGTIDEEGLGLSSWWVG